MLSISVGFVEDRMIFSLSLCILSHHHNRSGHQHGREISRDILMRCWHFHSFHTSLFCYRPLSIVECLISLNRYSYNHPFEFPSGGNIATTISETIFSSRLSSCKQACFIELFLHQLLPGMPGYTFALVSAAGRIIFLHLRVFFSLSPKEVIVARKIVINGSRL